MCRGLAHALPLRLESNNQAVLSIFHSKESQKQLQEKTDWIDVLEKHGIEETLFISRIVDINYSNESIKNFINAIEQVIKSVPDDSNLMVDLSNGTAIQKNLFSIVSYVLDIKHQYMIDVIQLSNLTKDRGFLPIDILLSSYISTPNSADIDTIAYLNLSEIVRYKKIRLLRLFYGD
ncbi:hypothetical protein [Aphanizomenon sp. UHCC 0183]|uniref:hypothetical protein n=1 Tax=Aphanizomenon sp. UHCC 0183 TaxID=2590028 RepID=UPI001447239E|nr:hypothetical protein [Aphanizomenon sp. UHCC 0183]MTJ31595.1 hypothetical protein [Aphanizomenon sp. UHCC 0183]QSV71731.1 MAG: hypothetical protein HEQ20_14480 [Aphanizomenon flos-aquae KM1D3_PB]